MTEPREEEEELTTLEPEKVSERNNGTKDLSLPSVESNETDYVGSLTMKKKDNKKKANKKKSNKKKSQKKKANKKKANKKKSIKNLSQQMISSKIKSKKKKFKSSGY